MVDAFRDISAPTAPRICLLARVASKRFRQARDRFNCIRAVEWNADATYTSDADPGGGDRITFAGDYDRWPEHKNVPVADIVVGDPSHKGFLPAGTNNRRRWQQSTLTPSCREGPQPRGNALTKGKPTPVHNSASSTDFHEKVRA